MSPRFFTTLAGYLDLEWPDIASTDRVFVVPSRTNVMDCRWARPGSMRSLPVPDGAPGSNPSPVISCGTPAGQWAW